MKKLLAVLLVLCLLLSLAACGKKDEPKPSESEKPAPQSESTAPTEPTPTGKTLETSLWTLTYDDTVWTVGEDDLVDNETYTSLDLTIPDPDDEEENLIWVSLSVSLEDASSFRSYLTSYGFDHYEYAVNNAYDFVPIGGLDCLFAEGNYWGSPCMRYLNRFESCGATVLLMVIGEYQDERVDALLDGLNFTLTDTGNVDFPWAWDGTPFSSEGGSAMAATYTVNSQWLPLTDDLVTDETFKHAVSVAGDQAYLLSDGALLRYRFDGASLSFEEEITLPDEYEVMQTGKDGTLWLSSFMNPLICYKDGVQTASYEGTDYVAMHSSGDWGVSYFSSAECTLLTFSDGIMSTSPIVFGEVSTINRMFVVGENIFVCGNAADDSGHKVFIYDRSGALQNVLADSDGSGLGSITFVTETPNGYLASDGNMREIVLWSKDGTYIGSLDDKDLFGTHYPWFCGGVALDDGSILLIMTEDRADQSAMELVAFRLSGF